MRISDWSSDVCSSDLNDNVYRQAIIGMLFWLGVSAEQKTLYATLAPAIFILPYFLFSALAGRFAERTEKATLIRITTALEIAIMSLAALGFATTNMTVLLVAPFLSGVESTPLAPVTCSLLPDDRQSGVWENSG